jgi:hypothetical protein
MHWLIPVVSHSVSSLIAWAGDTITPTAVLLSIIVAASQSIHLWSIFCGLLAVFFVLGTFTTAISRRLQSRQVGSNSQNAADHPGTRTTAYLLANLLAVAALVPLHLYYMKQRMANVPWFNIGRAPAGCLPIPSRTLTKPWNYTFADAVGNQLPFGVVVSYAAAVANTFDRSVASRDNGGWSGAGILAGFLGACTMALTAAYGLPMCDDSLEGSHETMMHVDRSTAWGERTSMTWSWESRYGTFVVLVTLAGASAVVVQRLIGTRLQRQRMTRIKAGGQSMMQDVKVASEKTETAVSQVAPGAKDSESSHLATFCANAVVTGSVIMAMAVWSYTGGSAGQVCGQDLPSSYLSAYL